MTGVAVVSESALLDGSDRIVVSPAHGKLSLPEAAVYTVEGEVVRAGGVLARVDADGRRIDVCSPCDAWVMDYLARDGERVEPGSAIVHLRAL